MLQGALVATPHSLLPAVVAVAPRAVQMARRHAKRQGVRSLPDTMQDQNSCSGILLLAEPPARLHIKAHQPSANPSAPGEGGRKKDIKRNSESKQFGETQHAAVWAPRPAMVLAGRLGNTSSPGGAHVAVHAAKVQRWVPGPGLYSTATSTPGVHAYLTQLAPQFTSQPLHCRRWQRHCRSPAAPVRQVRWRRMRRSGHRACLESLAASPGWNFTSSGPKSHPFRAKIFRPHRGQRARPCSRPGG